MSSFNGKVIAVTGGASGIGLETAKLLARRGAKASIAVRQESQLQSTEREIRDAGGEVMTKRVDVRNRKDVESWVDATVARFGTLHGVANMAGIIQDPTPVSELSDEQWDLMISVNLTGLMHCMRAQLPKLADNGSMVNAGSIVSVQGMEGNSAYAAAKHGVVGITKCAAKEVGARGIRVNCVAPGLIDTPMLQRVQESRKNLDDPIPLPPLPFKRLGKPEEIANLVVFLLSGESSFITGAVYSIDGGWTC